MKEPILKIEHLSHRYSSSWAIRDINLQLGNSGIMGLLGSNGAGKSTTMNIMCGVLKATEGHISIDGVDMMKSPEQAKKKLGFLPQNAPLYMDFTVDEYLTYCAGLKLMNISEIKPALEAAKQRCGIAHFSSRLIRNLSGGYRQRVGIAQAIIHRPRLVVLDEPTNGLDPNQIVEVRGLIREIAQDRAVIFSSHILSEIQLLCNDITMIENGKVVFAGTMDAFNNYVEPHSVLLSLDNTPSEDAFLQIPGVTGVDVLSHNQVRLFFNDSRDITKKIIAISIHHGWELTEIGLDKSSIDEIFAQLSSRHQNIS